MRNTKVEAKINTNPNIAKLRKVSKMLININEYSPSDGNLDTRIMKYVHPKITANIPILQRCLLKAVLVAV